LFYIAVTVAGDHGRLQMVPGGFYASEGSGRPQGTSEPDVSELGVKPFRIVFDDGKVIPQMLVGLWDLSKLNSSPGALKCIVYDHNKKKRIKNLPVVD